MVETPKDETEAKQLILQGINSAINSKLDDKILGGIDEIPKGNFDPLLKKYKEIAKNQNLEDRVEIINLIFQQIGEQLTEREYHKLVAKENGQLIIEQKEKRLEDYLTLDNNIEQIEKGLQVIRRQSTLQSGDIDIEAIDKNSMNTFIELKTGYDSPVELSTQLLKYKRSLDLKLGDNYRLMLVAPEIDKDLFFSLRGLLGDRFSAYTVTEEEQTQTYKFIQVTEKDFPTEEQRKKQKRNMAKSNRPGRKRQSSGMVKIKPISVKQYLKKDLESIADEEENENVKASSKPSNPLAEWYQSILRNVADSDQEKAFSFKKKYYATQEQKNRLKNMISSNKLRGKMSEHKKFIFNSLSYDEIRLFKNYMYSILTEDRVNSLNKSYAAMVEYENRFIDIESNLFKELNRLKFKEEPFEEAIRRAEDVLSEYTETIKEAEKDKEILSTRELLNSPIKHSRLNQTLGDTIKAKEDGELSENLGAVVESYNFSQSLLQEKTIEGYFRLKIDRAKELSKVDEKLGLFYLSITPDVFEELNSQSIFQYIKADSLAFLKIFKDLQVYIEGGESIPASSFHPAKKEIGPKERIIKAMTRDGMNGNYSEDAKTIINSFAENITGKLEDEDIGILVNSFEKSKLYRTLRNRDNIPSDYGLNYFLSNIASKSLSGNIPGHEAIKELYEEAIKKFGYAREE